MEYERRQPNQETSPLDAKKSPEFQGKPCLSRDHVGERPSAALEGIDVCDERWDHGFVLLVSSCNASICWSRGVSTGMRLTR